MGYHNPENSGGWWGIHSAQSACVAIVTISLHFVCEIYCLSNPGPCVLLSQTILDKNKTPVWAFDFCGGWWGIRTPGRVAPSAVFKTVAFDRSANHPKLFSVRQFFQTGGFGNAQTSFALTSLRSQDRRYWTALPTILNFFSCDSSFKPAVLVMRKLRLLLPRFAVKTVAIEPLCQPSNS